jgi:hypothetical protein
MKYMILTRRFCSMAVLAAMLPAQALAGVSLAPHRAFYVLEPLRLDEKGGITAISGKLAYEITGSSCEGYAVSYRIANRYVQGEGSPQVMDIQLSSYESGDGLELDMRQKQYVNAQLDKETRVKAKKPKGGGDGEGKMEGKETKNFSIDAAAVFPSAFQLQMMQDAEKGQTRTSALVFEGSDDDKPVKAVGFIGAKKASSNIAEGSDATTLASLNKLAAWPVTVSYYNAESSDDAAPTYTASFNMLENGVSTDLVLDYGSYALKGKLEKIELLKQDNCN